MSFFIIYKTINIINNRFYIGKHTTTKLEDDYLGSGKLIRDAIKKYGKEKFTREILFFCETREELNEKEREILTETFIKENKGITYNLSPGGQGGNMYSLKSEEDLDKIKRKSRGPCKPETKKKLSEKLKGCEGKRKSKYPEVDLDMVIICAYEKCKKQLTIKPQHRYGLPKYCVGHAPKSTSNRRGRKWLE